MDGLRLPLKCVLYLLIVMYKCDVFVFVFVFLFVYLYLHFLSLLVVIDKGDGKVDDGEDDHNTRDHLLL